ncbi:uncharacterized protein LOC113203225 isoform X2 [Frankliniella occidentalis]|nr:uncharacterized protein LOC113203225 isoform X2 [Frankliniella occidentalis]XP_052130976.1 uncharacterized protein LOC113203225 isoform X2 [Frankliniella occidentalis]XP_052130977.1 uncharacterized protein LOC113203225 isoform X2 [Frankliniella occidentalis]
MPAATGHGAASTMPREAHRPYRFGMTLLCFGGLLNWVGLFENYTEPVRYIGVTCVVSGAILLCFAICCWLRPGAHRENAWGQAHQHANPALQAGRDPVHFITLDRTSSAVAAQKPPDYESVTDKPPSYDDAIKLSPALLWLANEHERHEGELLEQHAEQGAAGRAKDDAEEMTVSEVDDAGSPLPPGRQPCPPYTAVRDDRSDSPRTSTAPSTSASTSSSLSTASASSLPPGTCEEAPSTSSSQSLSVVVYSTASASCLSKDPSAA